MNSNRQKVKIRMKYIKTIWIRNQSIIHPEEWNKFTQWFLPERELILFELCFSLTNQNIDKLNQGKWEIKWLVKEWNIYSGWL